MNARRPLLPLRLERWRVPPGWRWFRLPGYARRWDRALDAERDRRENAARGIIFPNGEALDRATYDLSILSREVGRAVERGRLP